MKREEGEVVYGERQHTPREPLLLQRALFRSVRCRLFFFCIFAVSDAGILFFGGDLFVRSLFVCVCVCVCVCMYIHIYIF